MAQDYLGYQLERSARVGRIGDTRRVLQQDAAAATAGRAYGRIDAGQPQQPVLADPIVFAALLFSFFWGR